jgi:cation diffusion facilitator CzcD-associated flavoprotein CzcO
LLLARSGHPHLVHQNVEGRAEAAQEWRIVSDRDGSDAVLRPKHLVLATGMSGKVNLPTNAGMQTFKGHQHHSSKQFLAGLG